MCWGGLGEGEPAGLSPGGTDAWLPQRLTLGEKLICPGTTRDEVGKAEAVGGGLGRWVGPCPQLEIPIPVMRGGVGESSLIPLPRTQ